MKNRDRQTQTKRCSIVVSERIEGSMQNEGSLVRLNRGYKRAIKHEFEFK